MKILDTERLYLREFMETDLERLTEIYSDIEVMKYIGKGEALSNDQTLKIINFWTKKYYDEYGFGIWGIVEKKSDLLIGHCGFNWLQDKSDIEIAYLLAKEFWGKGFATEISNATLNYGFKMLKLNKIVALAYPENYASVKIIKKLGMNPEGEKFFFGARLLYFVKMSDE